jgi:hypothetical protein
MGCHFHQGYEIKHIIMCFIKKGVKEVVFKKEQLVLKDIL